MKKRFSKDFEFEKHKVEWPPTAPLLTPALARVYAVFCHDEHARLVCTSGSKHNIGHYLACLGA